MYKLCVFGGTTEGRELVEFLNTQPCRVTACVATEYGQTLLPEGENLTVSARPLPVGEIGALLQAERFDLVIDATHPYAASITRSIAAACEAAGVEHWRLLRGASEAPEDAVFAENTDEAVRFLSGTEGNILLTTGSKELSKFAALPDFAARCWARVLPLPAHGALRLRPRRGGTALRTLWLQSRLRDAARLRIRRGLLGSAGQLRADGGRGPAERGRGRRDSADGLRRRGCGR